MKKDSKEKTTKKQVLIVETARELFSKYGMKKVSVEEICNKAGVSKMTFYRHHKNKASLAAHILSAIYDESFTWFEDLIERDQPVDEKIREMLKHKAMMLARLGEDFVLDIVADKGELNRIMLQAMAKVGGDFRRFIVKGQERGEIRAELKPEFVILMLDKMQELGRDEGLRGLFSDYTEFALALNHFFYYGILMPPEAKK